MARTTHSAAPPLNELEALRQEATQLRALIQELDDATWWKPSPFKNWTPFDVISHLHESDSKGLIAVTNPDEYRRQREIRRTSPPAPEGELPRERVATRDSGALLDLWWSTLDELCDALAQRNPDLKVPWAGPDMSVARFAAARLMEIWAHGQDIFDLLKKTRLHHDRIRPIADLGVRTFRWTFANRALKCPEVRPHVSLISPSGARWSWNPPSAKDLIEGDAVEFCQVVTQVRNVGDTNLRIEGQAAHDWMSIAQCFAGVPRDPPGIGERAW